MSKSKSTATVPFSDYPQPVLASAFVPPPPGFFPEDISLYKQPAFVPIVKRGPNTASPGATCGRTKCTPEELIAARVDSVARACAPILPTKLPLQSETHLLLWCRALIRKQEIVTELADVQLDCEELERDVADGLGEEIVQNTLDKFYICGDTCSAKGRLMLSISNVTYKSVEK